MAGAVVAVSGYDDMTGLAGLLLSVEPFALPVVYLDGAHELYHREAGGGRWDRARELANMAAPPGVLVTLPALEDRPWTCEAEKREHLAGWIVEHREVIGSPDWILWLDDDERLEGSPPALAQALEMSRGLDWLDVNLWRPDHTHAPQGFDHPRIMAVQPGITFDRGYSWVARLNGERFAYKHGERVSKRYDGCVVSLSPDIVRIRHERRARTAERLRTQGRYKARRAALEGRV